MKKLNKNNKGFSLVELLVVIAIMVVLVGVIAPTLLGNIEKSRVAADIQALDSVASAVQVAIGDEKAYTDIMSTTTKGKALKVSDYFGTTAHTGDFGAVVHENLAGVPDMKGSLAKTNQANMYFAVTENGRVVVWLATDAVADGTAAPTTIPTSETEANTARIVFAKNTVYMVIR